MSMTQTEEHRRHTEAAFARAYLATIGIRHATAGRKETEAAFARAYPNARISMINEDTVTVSAASIRVPDGIPGWRIYAVDSAGPKAYIIYKKAKKP